MEILVNAGERRDVPTTESSKITLGRDDLNSTIHNRAARQNSTVALEPVAPFVACITVWLVLNCMLIACMDDRNEGASQFGIDARTACAFQSISSDSHQGSGLQARFLAPLRFGNPVPLVVFLHGSGQRGYDNIQQLQTLPQQLFRTSSVSCAILAPQCPPQSGWDSWIPELEELIEQTIRQHRIDPNRVYLTGLSMGGFGSWELAARRPDLFAAVVPICGGGHPDWAERLKQTPLWAVHGAEDRVVPPEHSRDMIQAIQSAGGTPHYSELPGVGHDSWHLAYAADSDILKWMFQQRRSSNPE